MVRHLPLARWTSLRSRLLAVAATSAVVVATEVYYALTLTSISHPFSVVIFGVGVPLAVGCILLLATSQLVPMLGFVAIFLSVVDDSPILFDWPRFNSFLPWLSHYWMQIDLYVVSAIFLIASVGIVLWRSRPGWRKALLVFFLALLTFGFCYADDVPLRFVKDAFSRYYYPLYGLEHLLAVLTFSALLLSARRPDTKTMEKPQQ